MDEPLKQKILDALRAGKSLKQVAKMLFMSEQQLRLLAQSWGYEFAKRTHIERPERNELMTLYASLGSTGNVAKRYKVSIGTVVRWMRELNLPMKRMRKMTKKEKVEYLEKHLESLGNINL